ncbi:MAG: L,D-transpeptidase, partial [Planctomycetota bacterium]
IDLSSVRAKSPPAPARDEAAWRLDAQRREALEKGDTKQAAELSRRLLRDHAASDPARWVHYEEGRQQLHKYQRLGKTKEGFVAAREAWRRLTPVLFLRDAPPPEEQADLRETLAKLANDLLLSPRHIEGVDRVYVPKRGESLSVLCKKVFPGWGARVDPGFLVSVNRLRSAKDLRAGDPIKVPLGEPEIVIRKREYRLYYLFNGCFVRDFAVGLGKEGSTPEAKFVIWEKIRNPAWNPRAGVVIPYGDPRNILGTRWMAFRDSAEHRGFGIHGTSDPSSIAQDASSGCVRMLREDVERLFDWTPRGTRVTILR